MYRSMSDNDRQVEAKNAPVLLTPEGQERCVQIAAHARGRPSWRIRWLFVPRLPYVAGSASGRVIPTSPFGIPKGGKLHDTVSAAIAQREPWPHVWAHHELAQLRRLYIAALTDIAEVKDDPRDTRVATSRDRDARLGRELWASVGAWPWSLFGPRGGLPGDWSQDELVVTAWRHWVS